LSNYPNLEETRGVVCNLFRDGFHSKPESRKAKKYLIEQLVARGYKRDEIAERLGVSRKTIYNILKTSL